MARIRCIKPDFFRHEALFEAERASGLPLRVAFAGLLTVADREGRFRWRPRQLKLDVLPFDDVDFAKVLTALATGGFLQRYTADGDDYGCFPSWHKHQIVNNRETASAIPPPPQNAAREARVIDASATRDQRDDHATVTPLVHEQGEGEREGKEVPEEAIASSSSSATTRTPTIPCPYGAIVDAYHQELPTWPRVRLRDGPTWDDRQKAMRKMWAWVLTSKRSDGARRAEAGDQALDWLRGYFARARDNDFLMGRTPRSDEHRDWKADFDFLLTKKGMKQVIEKTEAAA